eukprot:COSAG01_NODE_5944_length_3940_cov_25.762822_3_plen_119_part_00
MQHELRQQVEFYFSDFMLPGSRLVGAFRDCPPPFHRDDRLRLPCVEARRADRAQRTQAATVERDINGWVPIQLLCGFPRVRQIAQPLGEEQFHAAAMADLLDGSSLLELSRCRSRVRR